MTPVFIIFTASDLPVACCRWPLVNRIFTPWLQLVDHSCGLEMPPQRDSGSALS